VAWEIPLFDPDIGVDEIEAVASVLRSKWLTMGEQTNCFELQFANFIGARYAIAVNNCTAALHLALTALGVGPGDEVLTPSLTFVASANAVRYCGARPVFADVKSLDFWNVSVSNLDRVRTAKTRAAVVVHYAGYPCEMDEICDWAKHRGIAIVEDAAHAPGASVCGRSVGTWGSIGCFSFFSNKNMTTGEGGMLTTDVPAFAEKLRRLRSHGMTTLTLDRHKGHAYAYDVTDLGYNYRMSELNAALGIVQLGKLRVLNERRKELVHLYRERLSGIEGIVVPFSSFYGDPVHHIMPALLPKSIDRKAVMRRMQEQGVQTSIHYRPVDTFSAFTREGLGPCANLELTHTIGARALTLPLYPGMTQAQVSKVCTALETALQSGSA
jgi:dTDP-4-amino-4,6-dideoxygalactose transaminase